MGLMLYRVLPASGGCVNGAEAEARYEVDAGNVLPTGQAPAQPSVPTLFSTDLLAITTGRVPREVTLAALEAFLTREGGGLAAGLTARGDEVGVYLTQQLGALIAAERTRLLDGADAAHDTLGKLAAAIVELSSAVDAKAASADLTLSLAALEGDAGAEYDTLGKLVALLANQARPQFRVGLLKAARPLVPSSPEGLAPGEPFINGDLLAFKSLA